MTSIFHKLFSKLNAIFINIQNEVFIEFNNLTQNSYEIIKGQE